MVNLFWPIEGRKEESASQFLTRASTKVKLDLRCVLGFQLSKYEILRGDTSIKELFNNGSSFFLYPFKIFYKSTSGADVAKILFAVSGKHLRKATDRNMVRRRMKEAYRLQKHLLQGNAVSTLSISCALIYIGKEKLSYGEIEAKLKIILLRLNEAVYEKNQPYEE